MHARDLGRSRGRGAPEQPARPGIDRRSFDGSRADQCGAVGNGPALQSGGYLETQSRVADDLLLSYREQFNVGRRSLLDVLDAQNTRQNVQSQAETARMSRLYAQYRVLAASNRLIECLGVQMPQAAWSNERARFNVNPIPAEDLQENSMPMPVMGPPAPTGGR